MASRPAASSALIVVSMVLSFPWMCVLWLFIFALMGIGGWWFLLPPIGLYALLVMALPVIRQ